LILIGAISYFALPKAEIEIWPESETLNLEEKLTVDKTLDITAFSPPIIPGKIFEAENIVSEEFLSSGKGLKKAEGIIRLYNAYTTKSETWLAGTRFVSADGKIFKSKAKISVPGAEIKNGKIDLSYVDVPVIAAEPGSDYNIDPSYFSIYVYRGTPRYTKFYGRSFQAMSGGGEVAQVTQEDLDQAKEQLLKRANEECLNLLGEKIPSEFILLKDAVKSEVLETSSVAEAGDELEKFNYQVKAKLTALVFKNKDLEDFAKRFILAQTPKGKTLYQESLKISYLAETINVELGKITLSLEISGKIYSPLDEIVLKRALRGKTLAETQLFLENYPQITKASVKFWPFWVKKAPQSLEKIKINLRVD